MLDTTLTFPPFPWQQDAWSKLVALKTRRRLPHAFLLTADSGQGIEKFALAVSHYLLCADPNVEGQICGRCKACLLLKVGSHPDLKVLSPEEKSEQIRIDQIRELNHFLSQTAQQATWKIAVLTPAHAMNQNAANALLKNLEEPGRDTLFILVSDQANKIMPTIRSRCQLLSMHCSDKALVYAWLQGQGLKMPESYAVRLGLRPLTILQWFHEGKFEDEQKIIKDVQQLLKKQTTMSALSKKWSVEDPKELVQALQYWLEKEISNLSQRAESETLLRLLFLECDRLRQKRALLSSSANINSSLLIDELVYDLTKLSQNGLQFDLS